MTIKDMPKPNTEDKTIHWQVSFDGELLPNVRASLVEELIKFILYERRQIPAVYDLLKQPVMDESEKSGKTRIVDKKLESCISSIGSVLKTIHDAFTHCNNISEVALLIGPTVLSPKETFLFKLPEESDRNGGELLNRRRCVQTMMRKLVSRDLFHGSDLNPCSIHVMIHAPSDLTHENLAPKQCFTLPNRGAQFRIEIVSAKPELTVTDKPTSEKTNTESTDEDSPNRMELLLRDFDISGIGLLETTLENSLCLESDTNESEAASDGMTSSGVMTSSTKPRELIWYKVNTSLKGVKGKPDDHSSGTGWF